jgi:transcriptional regulator with XRE-family HTH domain
MIATGSLTPEYALTERLGVITKGGQSAGVSSLGTTSSFSSRGTGPHRSTLAKIEAGERRLDVAEFISIAGALKVEPEVLFGRVLRW